MKVWRLTYNRMKMEEEDEVNSKEAYGEEIPILSVRNTVLFPGVVIPITVGRQRSIRLVKKAQKT
jgi:ATP-dependent Lon protease